MISDLCPICSSQFVTGGSVEIEPEHARQVVSCDECHATWECEYVLANVYLIDVCKEGVDG